jgi:hypothetical protein
MFNPFKSESSPATGTENFVVDDELRIAIDEAGLSEDAALKAMIESGFVSPNGTEWDPLEFIAQRQAALERANEGAEAPTNPADNMVQHSPAPETEPRRELI